MRTLSAAAVAALLCTSCAGPPPPGDLVASRQQRITQPAPDADVAALVSGNSAFALDLHHQVASGDTNTVFSPTSITTALAMTYAGAKGDTAHAFESTLHIGLPSSQFHRAMNTVEAALASRGQGAQGKDGKPFRLNVLNQIFAQKGMPLEAPFLDTLASEYGAGVRMLDFVKKTEDARLGINAWVSGNTEGLIPELLAKGVLTTETRLTLVNTVYFNAAWATRFDKNLTSDAAFTKRDGSTKQVSTMGAEDISGSKAVLDGTQVIELPYSGGEVSMVLLVPAAGHFDAFEAGLTSAELSRHLAALAPQTFALHLPKFTARTQVSLGPVLKELGLGVAFTSAADFSGITTADSLYISDVVHEAVIRTDEGGTEAAAATAVVMAGRSAVMEWVDVNRPFLYAIRDVQTGAVLFMGRVVDP